MEINSTHQITDYYQFLEKTSGKIFNVLELDLSYIEGLPNKECLEEKQTYFLKSYFYQMIGSYRFIQKKKALIQKNVYNIKMKNNFSASFTTVNEKN